MKNIANNNWLLRLESWLTKHLDQVAFCIAAFGLFVYVWYGTGYYLNPDEASIFVMANRRTLWETYKASHSFSHPPLLIIVLHYVLELGNSVFLLRAVSSVLAAMASWLAFKWIKRTFGSAEAIIGLIFLSFSPAMISIACQIRQYAMLLFFICGMLYFLQRFLDEETLWSFSLYSVFLCGAILSHYSAILVVLILGMYVAIIFLRKKPILRVGMLWGISQIGVVVLYSLLYISFIRPMLESGFAEAQIQGFLKNEYFFPNKETMISFIVRSNLDFFSYTGGGKLAGIIVLVCFLAGVVHFFFKPSASSPLRTKRLYSFLLILPFILGCIGAISRVLPYGGSRHSSYLLPFAAAGIALCVVRVLSVRRLSLSLAAGMLLVPLWLNGWHPSNADPNMSDEHMKSALVQLDRKVPTDALLLVDDATHYVLAYYLARDHFQGWGNEARMGKYRVVWNRTFSFSALNFEDELIAISRSRDLKPGEFIWVMTVGWTGGEAFNIFLSGYQPGRIMERQTFGPITLMRVSLPEL